MKRFRGAGFATSLCQRLRSAAASASIRSGIILRVRRLLFFPDHGADPVWDLASEAMVPLESLPISDQLRESIRAWTLQWEKLASQQMEADDVEAGQQERPAGPVTPEQWAANRREGRAQWQRLQAELGGSWRVGWADFNEDERRVQWQPDAPLKPCPPVDD